MAALLVLGAQAYADQTNVVQNLNIRLTGLEQGRTIDNFRYQATLVDVVRVDTRRVIEALGAATGNTFVFGSKLVVVTPANGSASRIEVRDGTNKVDVTTFFAHTDLSDAVHSSLLDKRNGRFSSTMYNIQHFALRDSSVPINLHFEVSGFAVEEVNPWGTRLEIEASGAGDRNGDLLILRGSISVGSGQSEVVPDEEPPDTGDDIIVS